MQKQQSQKTLEYLQKLKDSGHWNDDYDYSEVEYVNNGTKVIIIDQKFNSKHSILPQKLINRNTNCIIRNCINKNEYLINEFFIKHGVKYDYSKISYTGTNNDVLIICKKHGEFNQKPTLHKSGSGCPKCGNLRASKAKFKSQDEVTKSFIKSHGDKYDYSKFIYKGVTKKAKIICRSHGVFEQTPVLV